MSEVVGQCKFMINVQYALHWFCRWWQVPYFYAGIKMYDLVAGRQLVKKSYFMNKEKALESFPMLKQESLCGAIVYYDGWSLSPFKQLLIL